MATIAELTNGCNTPHVTTYAEAPCSMNTMVEVQGLGRIQVTGRGLTPDEAAANLRGQIHVLLTPTTPPVETREARLASLLTAGLTKAVAKQDWSLVEKMTKAAALVLAGAVQPGEREGVMTIRSLTTPQTWYDFDEQGQCSCPDFTHRAGTATYYCKHALAVMLTQRLA